MRTAGVLAVEENSIPLAFSGPWPNPAAHSAHFSLTLPEAAPIELVAFDISGRVVRAIASGDHGAGRTEIAWNLEDGSGRRVKPGIYRVRMKTTGMSWVRQLTVTG